MRWWIAAMLVIAAARDARAGDTPETLYDAGRYPAAAAAFEHRWEANRDAKDGVNAVVAWRQAGRYARARALLARVLAETPAAAGDVADLAARLEKRLADLTATLTLHGDLDAAVVEIDHDVPERLGDLTVLDVGDREITIERERCQRWRWRGQVVPGAHLDLDVALDCDLTGTLHVVLPRERDAEVVVDGSPHHAASSELDVTLAPGAHRVVVRAAGRTLSDESATITTGAVTTRRVPVPWRASAGLWFLAATGSLHGSTLDENTGFLGFALGHASRRYRWYLDAGIGRHLDTGIAPIGFGGEITWHLLPALARRQVAGGWLQLECDPAALWARRIGTSKVPVVGQYAFLEDVTTLHLASASITYDAPTWHAELGIWPVGAYIRSAATTDTGYTFSSSLLIGFRI